MGINTQDHTLEDMVIDPTGYIYVTGGSTGIGPDLISTGFDIATIKYDFNGNLIWINRYNGNANGQDGPQSIALDASGNVYVGGVSSEQENPSLDASFQNTFITIKYNPTTGNRNWVKYFYGNSLINRDAWCYSITTDGNNNVICTGNAKMQITNYDFITIKYNSSGTQQWFKQYDFGNTEDYGRAIAVDNLNNVYVTGRSRPLPIPSSPSDYATIKYNSTTGNQEWSVRYNGTGNDADIPNCISVFGNNNVYVTGKSVGQGTDYDFLTIRYSNGWFICNAEEFSGNNDINEISFVDSNKCLQ